MTTMQQYVYLNNAATTYPKSPRAIQAFLDVLQTLPGGPRHGAGSDLAAARATIAECLQVEFGEVVFTAGATLAANQVIQAVVRPDNGIVLDNRSHNAVLRVAYGLRDVAVTVSPLWDAAERCQEDELLKDVDSATALVCLTAASNVTGSVYDLTRVIARLRIERPGCRILLDASQLVGAAGVEPLRYADFSIFPSHKHLYAPPGAAVIVTREELCPILFGGTGTHSQLRRPDPGTSAWLEVGTPNVPAIWAMAVALRDWFEHRDQYRQQETELTARLWEGIRSVEQVQLLGREPGEDRLGIVSFAPSQGAPESEWIPALRAGGIIARGGMHCSPLVHEQLGLTNGSVRLSLGRYNTQSDIDTASVAVREIAAALLQLEASKRPV